MSTSARESYLVTEVMTATPQKLQLMLIEAAIRSTERARQQWRDDDEQAIESIIRAQDIIGELLASLDQEVEGDLTKKVAAVYLFVFRTLMEASFDRDEQKLDDALKVLAIERDTWRQVCEQLGSRMQPDGEAANRTAVPPPKLTCDLPAAYDSPGSVSLEA